MNHAIWAAVIGSAAAFSSHFFTLHPLWFRRLTLLSGLLMLVASLTGLNAPLWFAAGFLLMWVVNRYVHPVCPACADDHNHAECSTRLHGLGWPLLAAFSLHALADGVSGSEAGVLLHKLPEGFAMGLLFRAAFTHPWQALTAAVAVQALTLAGGWLPLVLPAEPLEAAGKGSLLFLALHAQHALRPGHKVLPVGPAATAARKLPRWSSHRASTSGTVSR